MNPRVFSLPFLLILVRFFTSHKNTYPFRETSEDNERYGGSRRHGDYRAHDRSDEPHDDPGPRPSGASVGGGGTPQDDGNFQEQEGRLVPYTSPMLQPDHAVFLVRTFNVRTSKIKQSCEENYIRVDISKNFKTNIDPLLSTLTSKDRDTYHKAVKKLKDENEIKSLMPWGRSGARTAFDRGYDAGLASVRRDHKTKGGQSDRRAVRKQVNHTSYAYGPSRHEPLRQKDLSPYHKSTI